jgi:hypothetical protein
LIGQVWLGFTVAGGGDAIAAIEDGVVGPHGLVVAAHGFGGAMIIRGDAKPLNVVRREGQVGLIGGGEVAVEIEAEE